MDAPDRAAEAAPSADADPHADEASPREYSSPAMRLRAIPITMFATDGTLSLADGRLVFSKSRGRVVLDMPVHELHSVMPSPVGFHLWHGERRLKFAPGESPAIGAAGSGGHGVLDIAADLSKTRAALADYRVAKGQRKEWVALLTPLVGVRPPGARVSRPWPMWAWIVMLSLFGLAVVGGVTWYALATL